MHERTKEKKLTKYTDHFYLELAAMSVYDRPNTTLKFQLKMVIS